MNHSAEQTPGPGLPLVPNSDPLVSAILFRLYVCVPTLRLFDSELMRATVRKEIRLRLSVLCLDLEQALAGIQRRVQSSLGAHPEMTITEALEVLRHGGGRGQ